MKPVDLIEWAYRVDNCVVVHSEYLWSSVFNRFVPIGGIHLLIGRADGILTWLSLRAAHKGLLRAAERDVLCLRAERPAGKGCYARVFGRGAVRPTV